MMWNAVILLALAGAAFLLWQKHVDAREVARVFASRLCQEHGVQLLDQTVVFRGMRLAGRSAGLGIARSFSFDFSRDGVDRRRGIVTLVGTRLESSVMPMQ
jgi:hypothetical protein